MSWAFTTAVMSLADAVNAVHAARARQTQGLEATPQCVFDYIEANLKGLEAKWGPETLLSIKAFGHVVEKDSYEVGSASIVVQPDLDAMKALSVKPKAPIAAAAAAKVAA